MSFEQNYSGLDRALHRIAFSGPAVQLSAADVEKIAFGRRFSQIPIHRPIFITSVPRAGTTLLLEILGHMPGLASHCYRDMPFIMAPLLWNLISGGFRKNATLRERAHGDGMEVGYDSPEAFEEVLWRAFWPGKFKSDRIILWSGGEDLEEFREFFVAQMQKVLYLRLGEGATRGRYVSKNNANIARIDVLKHMFPDSVVLVPFRDPFQQAASLVGQHRRFIQMHAQDPFSKRYMRDIGHLEFGALHRPIAFEEIDQWLGAYDPESNDYWVAYWVGAFRHLLRSREQVTLVSYDRLCEKGSISLRTMLSQLDIPEKDLAQSEHPDLRPARKYREEDVHVEDPELCQHARTLHAELLRCAVN